MLGAGLLLAGCNDGDDRRRAPASAQRVLYSAVRDTAVRPAQFRVDLTRGLALQTIGDRFGAGQFTVIQGKRWRPLRFTGPWYSGSSLDEIQVRIGGTPTAATAAWYYGGFFASVAAEDPAADMAIYAQYVSNPTNRTEAPPIRLVAPGREPTATLPRITEMPFGLAAVRAQSSYGGTLELRFQSLNDFEYQAASAVTRWDIGEVRMSVFVTPVATPMNPTGPPPYNMFRPVIIEFEVTNVVAYDRATGNVRPDDQIAELRSMLQDIADDIESAPSLPFQRGANQFAHAFIHVQQQHLFAADQTPPERVDAIEIADDEIMLRTRVAEVHFSWSLRITRDGGPAPAILFTVGGMYTDGEPGVHTVNHAAILSPTADSPWMRIGTVHIDECGEIDMVAMIKAYDGPFYSGPLLRHLFNLDGVIPYDFEGEKTVQAVLELVCPELRAFVESLTLPAAVAPGPNRVVFRIVQQGIALVDASDADERGGYRIEAKLEILFL